MELSKRISEECERVGILWDGKQPSLIAPDVYLIKAVAITKECHTRGECRVKTYTILTGKDIKVML